MLMNIFNCSNHIELSWPEQLYQITDSRTFEHIQINHMNDCPGMTTRYRELELFLGIAFHRSWAIMPRRCTDSWFEKMQLLFRIRPLAWRPFNGSAVDETNGTEGIRIIQYSRFSVSTEFAPVWRRKVLRPTSFCGMKGTAPEGHKRVPPILNLTISSRSLMIWWPLGGTEDTDFDHPVKRASRSLVCIELLESDALKGELWILWFHVIQM